MTGPAGREFDSKVPFRILYGAMNIWKEFAANEVTHSMAHYLTTIHSLHERHGYARVSDVAKELEVTKGSVSIQMKHLKKKGLVVEDENRFLKLTPEGESIAREVMFHRQILLGFFQKVLGVDPVQGETDACKIEHLLSKDTSHQLLAMVKFLLSDDPTAKEFLEKFKDYKLRCPSLEDCTLCDVECLMDMENHDLHCATATVELPKPAVRKTQRAAKK